MNVVYGLLGGFLIMGSAGGLEQDTMSITECLMWATVGFGFAGLALKEHI
jgi:hypothetical protein|tara:strand:+ start:549 stop:698 length:150 start_codon:yes stop_codon:yes gene_type:complete